MAEDNYIFNDDLDELDQQILEVYKDRKAPGWMPFKVYDMVQSGYPRPDHGVMVRRPWRSTDEQDRLMPPSGMWCKVEDVRPLLVELMAAAEKMVNQTEAAVRDFMADEKPRTTEDFGVEVKALRVDSWALERAIKAMKDAGWTPPAPVEE